MTKLSYLWSKISVFSFKAVSWAQQDKPRQNKFPLLFSIGKWAFLWILQCMTIQCDEFIKVHSELRNSFISRIFELQVLGTQYCQSFCYSTVRLLTKFQIMTIWLTPSWNGQQTTLCSCGPTVYLFKLNWNQTIALIFS